MYPREADCQKEISPPIQWTPEQRGSVTLEETAFKQGPWRMDAMWVGRPCKFCGEAAPGSVNNGAANEWNWLTKAILGIVEIFPPMSR